MDFIEKKDRKKNNVVSCPCCSLKMEEVESFSSYARFLCPSCEYEKFLSINKITPNLYEVDPDYISDLKFGKDHRVLFRWCHKQTIKFLKRNEDLRLTKVLDVGCFNGFFVKELLCLGFDANGIDFNEKALEFGRNNYNLEGKIFNKKVKDLLAEGVMYDLVTIFDVIEHIEEFFNFLKDVSDLLQPNGILVIAVPNKYMCWRPALDWPPHHLSRFSPKSLALCVERLGFTPLFIAEQVSSFELLRNYVGSLFREKSIESLRGGQFKNKQSVNLMRFLANKLSAFGNILLYPVDIFMRAIGAKYICQIIIARK